MGPRCPLYVHTIFSAGVFALRLHETTRPCSVPTMNLVGLCNQKQRMFKNICFHKVSSCTGPKKIRTGLTIVVSNSSEIAPRALSRFHFLLGSSTSLSVGSLSLRMSHHSTWCQMHEHILSLRTAMQVSMTYCVVYFFIFGLMCHCTQT